MPTSRQARRGEPSTGSLRPWVVKNLGAGKAGIECPRCGGKASVNKRKWLSASDYKTRSCTYCFKTSMIPEDVK